MKIYDDSVEEGTFTQVSVFTDEDPKPYISLSAIYKVDEDLEAENGCFLSINFLTLDKEQEVISSIFCLNEVVFGKNPTELVAKFLNAYENAGMFRHLSLSDQMYVGYVDGRECTDITVTDLIEMIERDPQYSKFLKGTVFDKEKISPRLVR